MSSQQTAAGGTEEHTVQQENELQALASIFGDDFQDLRSKDPWKVTPACRLWLMLHPVGSYRKASATCRTFTTLPRGAPVFSGQEASRGAPLPAAQRAEQRRGVLRDSGPAGQVPSSIPRRVSAHPQNRDTYSHCGLLSLSAPQVIRRGQLRLLFFVKAPRTGSRFVVWLFSIFISHSSWKDITLSTLIWAILDNKNGEIYLDWWS